MPAKPAGTGFRPGTAVLVLAAVLTGISAAGCRGFLDDQKEMWSDFYYKPDALNEVKTTTSPDRRAKFIARLREPGQVDPVQHQEIVHLLADIAVSDPAPACRLAAIARLGTFEDPRRVPALQAAYYQATGFMPEVNSQIRQQALKALGQTGDPAARAELIRVARAGAKEDNYFDQQLTLDERLTAVRGLANFKDQETAAALAHILRTEKDVALRDRAHRSLETVTGRRLPQDAQALEQAVSPSQPIPAGGPLQPVQGPYTNLTGSLGP